MDSKNVENFVIFFRGNNGCFSAFPIKWKHRSENSPLELGGFKRGVLLNGRWA